MKGPLARHCWRLALSAGVIGLPAAALLAGPNLPRAAPDRATPVSSITPSPGTSAGSSTGTVVGSSTGTDGCVGPSSPSTPGVSARLVLVGQTDWVQPNQQFLLDLSAGATTASAGAPGLDVYVEVFDRLLNRSDFDQTLCNQIPTPLLQTFGPVPLSSLSPDPNHPGAVRLPIDVMSGPGAPKPPPGDVLDLATCSTDCAGVYPVQVILQPTGGTDILAELTTQLIITAPAEGSKPLALAWTLPVSAPPVLSPAGKPVLSSTASAGIATLAAALTATPDVPLTLAPSPITVAALAASSSVSDRQSLAQLAGWGSQPSHQVVALPYAPVSPASLAAAGLSSELAPQLGTGAAVVTALLHLQPDSSTWLSRGTLDQAALSDLAALPGNPVKRVVLSNADLAPLPEQSAPQLTPTQPFALASSPSPVHPASGADQIEAVTSDAGLAAHLAEGQTAVLSAHQLLADLAMIYYDLPNASYSRGVVLETPATWQPDATFLRVALGGLADSPIVRAVTIDQLFAQTPKTVIAPYGGVLVRQLSASPPPIPTIPGRSLQVGRQNLSAFASTLGPKPPPVLASLDEVLLAAESPEVSSSNRARYLAHVRSVIKNQFSSVKLQTDTVTLTSRTAQLPITISSNLSYPMTALLEVTSDKLGFGQQSSSRLVTLTQHEKTVEFEVRARATGKFPVQVSLVSPSGNLTIDTSRFAVRSSAISPVAIGLTVAAGLVLAGWWGRTLLKGRRHRNPRLISPSPVAE